MTHTDTITFSSDRYILSKTVVFQAGIKENRYTYTAREWDSESQTYDYRARQYNPYVGRFTARDPIEYLGGINLYSYVRNNAVNLTDSLGIIATPPQPRFDPETGEENVHYHQMYVSEPPMCCVLKFNVRRAPPGPRGWTWEQGSVYFHFLITADFANTPPPCECSCCEYRQEVKGFYMWGNKIQEHELLKGTYLKPNKFQEDGTPDGHRYGHKSDGEKCVGSYISNNCTYVANDEPGIRNRPYPMMFALDFKGTIVDTCLGGIVREKKWSIGAYAQDSPESGIDYDEGVD